MILESGNLLSVPCSVILLHGVAWVLTPAMFRGLFLKRAARKLDMSCSDAPEPQFGPFWDFPTSSAHTYIPTLNPKPKS